MNSYKIISAEQKEDVLITKVEYNFSGQIITVDINHFLIKQESDITTNILKRAQYELGRLTAIQVIESVIDDININTTIPIV